MNIFCLWTRLGRTMTPSNPQLYTSYMPFDVYMPKVAPKWPQSGPQATFICQKWSQSNPKSTKTSPNSFIKSLESAGKMNVFWIGLSYTQSDSIMIAKWPSSDAKSPTDNKTHPKLTPKWPKSGPARSAVRSVGVVGPILNLQSTLAGYHEI